MKSSLQILIFILFITAPGYCSTDTRFDVFIQQLFVEIFPEYEKLYLSEYENFTSSYNLDKNIESNRNKYFQIRFIHDLLTGNGASNCVSGGILEIPYFWHWVEPNPRHNIIFLSDSIQLSKVDPPDGFLKYKSYADVDRAPSLFISDLLTESPKYFHNNCDSFYSFGWCSEREMAYNTILTIMNFQTKIKQEGIHTWSELLVKFETNNREIKNIEFRIDNTFDIITTRAIENENYIREWQSKIGSGSSINWYNQKAHSKSEIDIVKNLEVNEKVSARIYSLFREWLERRK